MKYKFAYTQRARFFFVDMIFYPVGGKRVMKKIFLVAFVVCSTLFACVSLSSAATLSAIYEFSGVDPTQTSFEGLAFTGDTLWITSSPNSGESQLLSASLDFDGAGQVKTGEITSTTNYNVTEKFWFLDTFNPVALASDGENLFVTSNRKAFDNYMYTDVDPTGDLTRSTYDAVLSKSICNDPEGSAYLNGLVYVSCQDSKSIIAIDPTTNTVVTDASTGEPLVYYFENSLLGLGATEDALIVGEYDGAELRNLLLFDVATGEILETISLNDLFVGAESDYEQITGFAYEIDVENAGTDLRHIPDPDGIAYKDGKIYMTFEHDMRVFEISLTDDPSGSAAVPEPGTLLLIGIGLIGIAGVKRKHS